ncbi:hypothetical protein C482_16008 [Natrialba chahannaoensis JCM 10990]|uniref:SHOCT domain-containing protein n=2 Tax=Natrialba chahannaoensis TaxID=68911 RepID=M0ACP3_9EURY|nr:hypothetical protein C482_16008 [Natrialba chahannaoensis JCM 10990]
MVALFVFGVTVYFGVSYIITELHHGWTAAEPEPDPDPDEDEAKLDELNEMYERGEIDENELEERIEKVYSANSVK